MPMGAIASSSCRNSAHYIKWRVSCRRTLGRTLMNHRGIIGICVVTALGLPLLATGAVSQQQALKEQLIGTWTVVSWEQNKADGAKLQQFGANPTGIAFFDAGGRYIITVMRSDRARYASNALWR